MRHFALILILSFISSINALHFYLDANQKRCFIEELPTDTVVEGAVQRHIDVLNGIDMLCVGHYRALEWAEDQQKYIENHELGIIVEVQVSLLSYCRISGAYDHYFV